MESSPTMIFIEKLTFPVSYPMKHFMPTNKLPELVFLIILVIFFYATDFIFMVV